jgi:hypothetical protein
MLTESVVSRPRPKQLDTDESRFWLRGARNDELSERYTGRESLILPQCAEKKVRELVKLGPAELRRGERADSHVRVDVRVSFKRGEEFCC